MVCAGSLVCFYNRNGTYYFSCAVPSGLCHRFPKWKIEVSQLTKSEWKAATSVVVLSDRLEQYWDSLRLEMIYSKKVAFIVLPEANSTTAESFILANSFTLYHRLRGTVKTSLFFDTSQRRIRYLIENLGQDNLLLLEVSDACMRSPDVYSQRIAAPASHIRTETPFESYNHVVFD